MNSCSFIASVTNVSTANFWALLSDPPPATHTGHLIPPGSHRCTSIASYITHITHNNKYNSDGEGVWLFLPQPHLTSQHGRSGPESVFSDESGGWTDLQHLSQSLWLSGDHPLRTQLLPGLSSRHLEGLVQLSSVSDRLRHQTGAEEEHGPQHRRADLHQQAEQERGQSDLKRERSRKKAACHTLWYMYGGRSVPDLPHLHGLFLWGTSAASPGKSNFPSPPAEWACGRPVGAHLPGPPQAAGVLLQPTRPTDLQRVPPAGPQRLLLHVTWGAEEHHRGECLSVFTWEVKGCIGDIYV